MRPGVIERGRKASKSPPWWMWPETLGLSAPLVAVAWQAMFARAWGVGEIGWQAHVALGLAVWVIYGVDRWADVRLLPPGDPALGLRHAFVAGHRRVMTAGWVAAMLLVLTWAAWGDAPPHLPMHGVPVLGLTAGFFGLVVFSRNGGRVPWVRNVLAGLAFAAGTTLVARAWLGGIMMTQVPEVLAFGALCAANINAIHLWERERVPGADVAGRGWMLTLPLVVLGCAGWWVFPPVSLAAAGMWLLDRARTRMSLDALRVAADAVLVLPWWLVGLAG